MKKNLLIVFPLMLFVLLIGISNVIAESTKRYTYKEEDETFYIEINKKNGKTQGKGTDTKLDDYTYYPIENFNFHSSEWYDFFNSQPGEEAVYLYSHNDDGVTQNNNKWWASLYVCKNAGSVFGIAKAKDSGVFTNSMETLIMNPSFFNSENCRTYEVQDVKQKNKVYYCGALERYADKINELIESYKKKGNVKYKSEYLLELEQLKAFCNQVIANTSSKDSCVNSCLTSSSKIAEWNKAFGIDNGVGECGFSKRLINWLANIFKWIKYIVPVAVIVLGILDFIKALAADKDDEIKKAQGRFVKRLIAAALIFIVPFIIEFVMDKFGFTDYIDGCGVVEELSK